MSDAAELRHLIANTKQMSSSMLELLEAQGTLDYVQQRDTLLRIGALLGEALDKIDDLE